MMLFALVEPEEGDDHNVFVDGLLVNAGSENYKLPPAPELLMEFRQFLESGPDRTGCLIVGGRTPGRVRFGLGFEKRCFAAAEG
jgi:hypothetical protein